MPGAVTGELSEPNRPNKVGARKVSDNVRISPRFAAVLSRIAMRTVGSSATLFGQSCLHCSAVEGLHTLAPRRAQPELLTGIGGASSRPVRRVVERCGWQRKARRSIVP